MASELPENVLALLKRGIPTYAAAEFLLLIRKVGKFAAAAELCAMKQPPADAKEVEGYLAIFQAQGLIEYGDGAFRYAPVSDELNCAVEGLAVAYNERPVTLIRTIYALADSKIQSFADSFKIKEI